MINKERVNVLKKAIKEAATKSASLNTFSKYTFDTFCKENGLYKGKVEHKANNVWIQCPFHEDKTPSFSFNDELGLCGCFSCNSTGGNYIQFVYNYRTKVLGEKISWYQMLDRLLKDDINLQNEVGFTTIYEEVKSLDCFATLKHKRFKPVDNGCTSYLELQQKLLKRGATTEQIQWLILLMQSEVPVDMAERQLFSLKGNTKVDFASLED